MLAEVPPRTGAKEPFAPLAGLQFPAGPAGGAAADTACEWLAGRGGRAGLRRGSGMCAGSSRRLSHSGRSRGSDAGAVKLPSGRPDGAEQRGRGVQPVPRPHSAVPEAGANLGWGGARRAAERPWRRGMRRFAPALWGWRVRRASGAGAPAGYGGCPRAGGAAGAPELQPSPRAAAGAVGRVGRTSSESVSQRIRRSCKRIAWDSTGVSVELHDC